MRTLYHKTNICSSTPDRHSSALAQGAGGFLPEIFVSLEIACMAEPERLGRSEMISDINVPPLTLFRKIFVYRNLYIV